MRRIWLSRKFRYAAVIAAALLVTVYSVRSIRARPVFADAEAKLAELSDADRDRLMRNYERFRALDPAEQHRLVGLERQLAADPAQAELRSVMRNYYLWLKGLQSGQRAQLHALSGDELLKRIGKLRSDQQKQEAAQSDRLVLMKWLERQVADGLADERRRAFLKRPPMDRRIVAIKQLREKAGGSLERGVAAFVTDADDEAIEQLKDQFSPEFREQLDAADSRPAMAKLLGSKLSEWPRGGSIGFFDPKASHENKLALKRFFERDLSDDERNRLLTLAPNDMYLQLRLDYIRKKHPDFMRSGFPFGRNRTGGSGRGAASDQRGRRSNRPTPDPEKAAQPE